MFIYTIKGFKFTLLQTDLDPLHLYARCIEYNNTSTLI
jgi:hypothetical protein